MVNLNLDQWAEEQIGQCASGDKRRTRRLVRYAAHVTANRNASTPRQTESWADCKAVYSLIECEEVIFAAITQPHFQSVRAQTTQYETAPCLETITGVLSATAVRLLQLRLVARDEPQRPADQVVPLNWIAMLRRLRKRNLRQPWTVRDFYRQLAMLGGFLGRKSDGEPGWMTLWRGFEKLHLCLRRANAIERKCG
jgi:hypothetical protein